MEVLADEELVGLDDGVESGRISVHRQLWLFTSNWYSAMRSRKFGINAYIKSPLNRWLGRGKVRSFVP